MSGCDASSGLLSLAEPGEVDDEEETKEDGSAAASSGFCFFFFFLLFFFLGMATSTRWEERQKVAEEENEVRETDANKSHHSNYFKYYELVNIEYIFNI